MRLPHHPSVAGSLPIRGGLNMRHFLNLSDAGADGVAAMLADAIDR
jgi:hypothetical protein